MAKCFVILLLLLTSVLAATTWNKQIHSKLNNGRIVGGSDAPDGGYPHYVSVQLFGSHHCGGSIIDHEWILTAAHCVNTYVPQYYSVLVGTNKLSIEGTVYKVIEIHYHEEYDAVKFKNDIAVLKVQPIIYTDKVSPIVLGSEKIGGDESCFLSGWGLLDYPGNSPDNLQHIKLKSTTYEYCKNRHSHPVAESEICTLTKVGEGVCFGDSGSALIRSSNGTWEQIGITSWVVPCAQGYPDVFTRVATFITWIKEKCNCL